MIQINKRSIGVCILLSIITFGIYGIYWLYLLVKNTRSIQKNTTSCTGEMLCLIFVPFYSLYWWYTRGEKVKQEFSQHNYASTGNGIVYLILAIFGLSIVSMAIMQSDFNSLKSETHSEQRSTMKTKKMTSIAMLCAISYVVMYVGRIPMVMFLKYDPKDVIITIGGFIYGPLVSCAISTVVSLVEMITASETGLYGLLMNIVSTCSFACTASLIYKKKHTLFGAVTGLIIGCLLMTGVMLLWNYFITPHYLGQPQEAVAAMLLPVFLPFNLIKGGLNASITMLIYKPVVSALRKTNLIEGSSPRTNNGKRKLLTVGTALASIFIIICLVMIVMIIWK